MGQVCLRQPECLLDFLSGRRIPDRNPVGPAEPVCRHGEPLHGFRRPSGLTSEEGIVHSQGGPSVVPDVPEGSLPVAGGCHAHLPKGRSHTGERFASASRWLRADWSCLRPVRTRSDSGECRTERRGRGRSRLRGSRSRWRFGRWPMPPGLAGPRTG